jgi:hypothetical protein
MEMNELVALITRLVIEKLQALEVEKSMKVEAPITQDAVIIEQPKSHKLDKRVITEADIQKLARQGVKELIVDKKAIVTPLALDSIKIYNMKLIK